MSEMDHEGLHERMGEAGKALDRYEALAGVAIADPQFPLLSERLAALHEALGALYFVAEQLRLNAHLNAARFEIVLPPGLRAELDTTAFALIADDREGWLSGERDPRSAGTRPPDLKRGGAGRYGHEWGHLGETPQERNCLYTLQRCSSDLLRALLPYLLEHTGIDYAVGLGDVAVWQAAVQARLGREATPPAPPRKGGRRNGGATANPV